MVDGKTLVKEYRELFGKYTYDDMDCIGSIWKILKKYGAQASTIGSNWFARHEIINLRSLTDRSQLYDGCAVLKTVLPGEPGYALPDRYNNYPVKIDYNHIGIGTDDGLILDSTRYGERPDGSWERNGPGISTAPINSRSWDMIGDFEDVSSDSGLIFPGFPAEEAPIAPQANQGVVLKSVRMRKGMDTKSDNVVRKMNPNEVITIPDPVVTSIDGNDWVWAIFQGPKYTYKGYIVARDNVNTYISVGDIDNVAPSPGGGVPIESSPSDTEGSLSKLEGLLNEALRVIKDMIGNG